MQALVCAALMCGSLSAECVCTVLGVCGSVSVFSQGMDQVCGLGGCAGLNVAVCVWRTAQQPVCWTIAAVLQAPVAVLPPAQGLLP